MTKETKKVKEESKTEEIVVDSVVVENPEEPKKEEGKVGLLLKEMRNKQGKTFAEISQELCIRKSYLEAIENSDYNNIPEYPYGIGFIRSYADYLGLDGNNIVKMYKEEAEADFRKKHPYFVMEPQVEATVPSRKYLLVSLLGLVLVYAAWNAYNQIVTTPIETNAPETVVVEENNVDFPLKVDDYTTNTQDVSEPEENAEKDNNTENTINIVDVTSQENEAPQVVVTEKSFVEPDITFAGKKEPEAKKDEVVKETSNVKTNKSGLTINVLKETWIEVRNDKTLYISKVLQPGDSYTLPNAEDLRLSVGKIDGVEVMYNGKKAYEFAPNKKMNISVDEIMAGVQD